MARIQPRMRVFALFLMLFLGADALLAQTKRPTVRPPAKASAPKLTKEQSFILSVVRSAVGMTQPDPQDRLRVLNSAVAIVSTLDSHYAARLAKEGVEVESRLVAAGSIPTVSLMASGRPDCETMTEFVESLDAKNVGTAEASLIGAISKCPSQTLELVRHKTDTAVEQGTIAPRLLMALMEKSGASSPWTRDRFAKLFGSLPDPAAQPSKQAAPDYAAMYASMAPKVGRDLARSSAARLFAWLNRMEAGPDRSTAANVTASGLKRALGDKPYREFLEGDVVARQLVEAKGPPPAPTVDDESVSVLRAMGSEGTEQLSDLRRLPASLRAREAAALGFARGTAKPADKDSAASFFDIAFSAVDEAWSQRESIKNASGMVEEVSEAAAHVDAVDALRRAQGLQDPTAQALGMIAVARVASGRDSR